MDTVNAPVVGLTLTGLAGVIGLSIARRHAARRNHETKARAARLQALLQHGRTLEQAEAQLAREAARAAGA
ncbi:MAG: hypothetical protein IPO81_06160 [Kouleothrix sp.]|nr:hypothetical protein [Kouleothrix sp.]